MIKKLVLLLAIGLVGCGGGGSGSGSGSGSDDSTSKTPPSSPTAIQAKVNSNNEITLSWQSVTGAESYNIYYSSDAKLSIKNYSVYPNNGYLINVSSGHVIKNLPIAPIYYFVVTAVANGLESQQSQLIAAVTRYEIVGDGDIVRDKVTNLEWQRCSLGQKWNKTTSSCDGEPTKFYADKIVPYLIKDKDGWKIPTRDELTTLLFCDVDAVDYFWSSLNQCDTKGNKIAKSPMIKQEIFPNTGQERKYHVSDFYPDSYCSVGFGFNGFGCAGSKSSVLPLPNYIRLVRDIAKP